MNKKHVLAIMLMIFVLVLVPGCTGQQQTAIQSKEQVQESIGEIGNDVSEIEGILDDIQHEISGQS